MTKIRVTLKALTRLVMFSSINLHVAPEKKNNNKSNRIKNTINLRDSKLYLYNTGSGKLLIQYKIV